MFNIGDSIFFNTTTKLAVRGQTGTAPVGTVQVGICTVPAGTSATFVQGLLDPSMVPAAFADKFWEDVAIAGGTKTLDIEDNGKVMNVTAGHASNTVACPTGAAGNEFIIRCATTGQNIIVSLVTGTDKLWGADLTGTVAKGRVFTGATSRAGDYLALVGVSGGYIIRQQRGTFAAQP